MISDTKTTVMLLMATLLIGCGQSSMDTPAVDHSAEVADLERHISELNRRLEKSRLQVIELSVELGREAGPAVVGGYRSAPEIIEELMELKITSTNRNQERRRIGFLLESLAEQGEAAVPHISDFLDKMEDVDFEAPRSEKDMAREIDHWRSRMVQMPLDFETPPTLRIGLIDILAEIGSADAEAAIANVLRTTGRGFEVAYCAKKLRTLRGGEAYRNSALGAAHELLTAPIALEGGNKYDAASRQYLFMVLKMYQDKTFVQTAQGQLINDEGRIDQSVLKYFENIGDGGAIGAVVQAMQSGQLRESDMREMARVAVQGVGKDNVQADSLFQDIMTSDQYSLDVKMETIRSMDNSEDLTNLDKDGQAAVLQSRLEIMSAIQYGEDDIMGRASEIYSSRVESKLAQRDFGDEKQYEAMHNDFRKIRDQVRREDRSSSGNSINGSAGPTIITGRPGG